VFADNGFTMSGGSITGNTALMGGGGVYAAGFTMTGGTIAGNTARQYGGGVLFENVASTFTIRGGTIAGNTGIQGGGGVAVKGGTLKKEPLSQGGSSGVIYGNNAGVNSNRATLADTTLEYLGQAVYITPEAGGPKTREVTAGPDQHLDSTKEGAPGGWIE
jgi:hypothetical protein